MTKHLSHLAPALLSVLPATRAEESLIETRRRPPRPTLQLLCVHNFSNQVDEEAHRVNWEHSAIAMGVKLYSWSAVRRDLCVCECDTQVNLYVM